jgi:mxaA protein
MTRLVSVCFALRMLTLVGCGLVGGQPVRADPGSEVVKSIAIRAPRDMGYFAGDLINVDVVLTLTRGTEIESASLPHPGPITYWLDLRSIDVDERRAGGDQLIALKMVYQNFYDALDARPMEIPSFAVRLKAGADTVSADVPAWTIGVSPLREVAPPVKDDPKDYMQPDRAAVYVESRRSWLQTAAFGAATILALIYLAFDRAWWPFHARPARAFGGAVHLLRKLRSKQDTEDGYLQALFIMHRGIDQTDHRRVMADDLPGFLERHSIFRPLENRLRKFFSASRQAFFASNTARSQQEFPFDAIEGFAREMAEAERTRP